MKHRNVRTSLFLVAIMVMIAGFWLFYCKRPQKEVSGAFPHPEWSRDATIYEVNIRQYTPEGTFRAFEAHLPRLQQMGVKILWLMPIHPIGVKNRKGSLGSYYSVQDYLKVNPEFGTENDFRSLVKKVHDLGMYVIIDWVANHTAWDNPLITEHPEWYRKDSAGRIVPPVPDWTDVACLDYGNTDLRKWMTHSLVWWVKEYDIDGYRCDVAGMLPVSFWNEAVPEIRKIKPIFMLAEWEAPEAHDTAFDATYSWELFYLMYRIAQGKKSTCSLDSLFRHECSTYPSDAYRMRFTSNHDENSWNGTEYERLGAGVRAFAVLTFTFPGMPLIYTGQEAAMTRRLLFFDKDTVPWGHYSLAPFYRVLAELKKSHPALWNDLSSGDTLTRVKTKADSAVYAFLRQRDTDIVLVILNLSDKDQRITLSGCSLKGNFTEIFSWKERTFPWTEMLALKPWEYLVFIPEQE